MAKDGLLCAKPPSEKYRSPILMTGKKVGAAEVARAASQTVQMKLSLQDILQIGTAACFNLEYCDGEQCSLQITALMDDISLTSLASDNTMTRFGMEKQKKGSCFFHPFSTSRVKT